MTKRKETSNPEGQNQVTYRGMGLLELMKSCNNHCRISTAAKGRKTRQWWMKLETKVRPMEKYILYFQTEKSAEEAKERLCSLVEDWQVLGDLRSLEPLGSEGQVALVLQSTDRLDEIACPRLIATAKPLICIWNMDAWADTSYRHTFYYSRQDNAQDTQDFIHHDTAVLAWSKVIPETSGLYKVLFGTKTELTEREQQMWIATFDPEEFEFNGPVR